MYFGLFRNNFFLLGNNSFRDKKISDCFQLLIAKKPVSFDYVAIDATALVATALRLSKHVSTEQRRNKEVARHVVQNIQQFLRKIHCKKSLLIALDGPESLLKAHTTRSSAITKRLESRLVRLPGTSLMQAVEERIVRLMPDRHITCSEVVVCGTRVPGGVEEKITSWALDLSCHPKHESNQETLTMLGPTELFMNVMGLTPYFHVSSLIQHGSDLRQIRWVDMLEWLELNPLACKGDSLRVARARTDALFLYILANGCSATDLPAVHGCSFSFLYHRYCEINGWSSRCDSSSGNAVGGRKSSHNTRSSSNTPGDTPAADSSAVQGEKGSSSASGEEPQYFLFEDLPKNEQRLDLAVLYKIVQSTSTRMKEEREGRVDPSVDSYIAHAMSTHHMFSLGTTPLPDLLPMYLLQNSSGPMLKSSSSSSQSGISMMQLAGHLRAMLNRGGEEHLFRSCTSFSSSGVSPVCMLSGSGGSSSGSAGNSSSSSSIGRGAKMKIERLLSPCPSSSPPLPSTEKTNYTVGKGEEHESGDERVALSTVSPPVTSSTSTAPTPSITTPFIPHHQYIWSRHQPLTAGEFTILSYSQAHLIEAALQQYVGASPKPDLAKKLSDERKVFVARTVIQEALSYANGEHPHPCLCFGPSYLWEKNERSGVWTMAYIDVGAQSEEKSIRRYHNAKSGLSMSISEGSEEGPCFFDCRTKQWESITHYPFELEEQKHGMSDKTLKSLEEAVRTVTPPETSNEGESGSCTSACSSQQEKANLTIEYEEESGEGTNIAESGVGTRDTARRENRQSKSASDRSSASSSCRVPSGATMLKVLTWNVMFDRYSGQPTPLGMPGIDWCSPQRYPVLSLCLEREDADIIALQEVEHAFARYLAQQPWCYESYLLSCTPSSSVLDPWGVMMLIRRSRFTVKQLTHVNVPAWSGHVSLMPIVSIAMNNARRRVVDLAAVHLIAPFTKANEAARTGQDAALRQRAVKGLGQDAIIMGDFNDWPGNEFVMPPETLYRECWPQLYPDNPGKTMDDSNTFCQLKVEEIFFGRSDKIFLRSRNIQPIEGHLVGTKSVNAENGNKEAPAYLFPSDHYGVSMTFSVPL